MKTLTSHFRRPLPALLIVLFSTFITFGQSINNQANPVQTDANFNIDGTGKADVFSALKGFNIGTNLVLSVAGTSNIFGGASSGEKNTGSYNSFFGAAAGFSNTEGTGNSFVGAYAGNKTLDGNNNSFLGHFAGFLNTKGSNNSFIGESAGYNNTIGINNSFLGTNAGRGSTGSNNAFIGFQAGYKNGAGDYNSFVGSSAGYSSEGNYNSFFGSGAGYKNTTGKNNLFLGANTGLNNTTGTNNTLIGVLANVSLNNLTYATAIGSGAVVSTSNTIVLGRVEGQDKVRIMGLASQGTTTLCRNGNNEIAACSSSLRYKKNVAPFSPGLNLLGQLRPIGFEWKDGGMKDVGFGAEDVAAVEPLLVTYNAEGEVEGVKYDRIVTVLVNAVKEQQEQLRQQQIVIDGLKKLLCGQNPKAGVCKQ
jgi:hypothetical protein